MQRLKSDPFAFRSALLIDTDDGPQRYADLMDDFQRTDMSVLDPACRRVIGQKVDPPYMRAYLERGRGSSKTTDIAVAASYLLFASDRKLSGVVAAADRDQAK